jgi:glycosyltransferase involved in cell wall biosynthesis
MSINPQTHTPHSGASTGSRQVGVQKVLIITYYWPPSGGSGVQRWLKFVKYLPSFQWEPHVFTPENPAFAIKDPSLEKEVPIEAEVMRFPIWEPYEIFFKLSGIFGRKNPDAKSALPSAGKGSMFQRISTWVRGNFFVPDPRVFWVKPSAKFLADYLSENGIQIVVTTGPPHSVHLIGLRLKKKYPHLRWIADFRDPWTQWGMWDSLGVSKLVRKFHRRMEKKVLATADEIVTITPFYVRQFEELSARRVTLLTNGFDEADFKGVEYRRPEKFTIRHVGIVNERCDPRPFMRALKHEISSSEEFANDVVLEFNGEVHPAFRYFVESDSLLKKVTRFTGNIPHAELLNMYGKSSLFLLILTGYKDAEGFLPGKLFEYLATGLPILGVGPVEGDAAFVLNNSRAGVMIADDDAAGIQSALRRAYRDWKEGVKPTVSSIASEYSRQTITGKLVQVLERHAMPTRRQ